MNRVAVTGLGCVTPVGNDVAAFWDSVSHGRHGFAPITRFDAAGHKVRIAAEVKGFDPERYLDRNEIRRTDLFAQYALAAAAQAMADCGLAGAVDPDRFGVYIGSGIGGMTTFMAEDEKWLTKGIGRISPLFIPKMIANMASALTAMKYDARGVNLPVVTACATSTHAVGEAFRAIRHGYADAILAGGAEAVVNPLAFGGFTNCQTLSTREDPDDCSIPFDARRDGFVLGEGAGVLALESYDHAVRRGARIYCELTGYGSTCDAYHITAPHPEGRGGAKMMELALKEAGVTPGEGLVVSAHGTSTELNDRVETLAIKKALGAAARLVPVSALKSMTGHTLGAAGAIAAVAAVKTVETGLIPPTLGLRQPDPDCDLDYVPGSAREADVRHVLTQTLGFGGHNAGVVFSKREAWR